MKRPLTALLTMLSANFLASSADAQATNRNAVPIPDPLSSDQFNKHITV